MEPLLDVRNLVTQFGRSGKVVKAVDGVSFTLNQGETLGLVGESGSGKSVTVMSLLRLLRKNGKIVGGQALFQGQDLLALKERQLQKIRGKDISMIFQDPLSSLNPTFRVGKQMVEPLMWHKMYEGKLNPAKERVFGLLKNVGISEYKSRYKDYPFQFSGGMRQRVMIAMGMTCEPKLLIADEPTTALDVTVRSQILNLMQDMKDQYGMSIILITHDFCMAANFCDKIIVLYAGRVMEQASTTTLLRDSRHPYSKGLLESVIDIDAKNLTLNPIPGSPPNLTNPPSGCRFHPRCVYCQDRCKTEEPQLQDLGDGHLVACHFAQGGLRRG